MGCGDGYNRYNLRLILALDATGIEAGTVKCFRVPRQARCPADFLWGKEHA